MYIISTLIMEQITEQHSLTFEDICPEFSKIISQQGGFMNCLDKEFISDDGKTRSIHKGLSYIIGEAHGG